MYGRNDNLRLDASAKYSSTAGSQGLISTYSIYTWWVRATWVAAACLDRVSVKLIVTTQKLEAVENSSMSKVTQHGNCILEK